MGRIREAFDILRGNRAVEATGASIDSLIKEDMGWRRLGAMASDANMQIAEHDTLTTMGIWFVHNSPLAIGIIDKLAAHICGSSLAFTAKDDNLTEALNEFWNHPDNKLDELLPRICREWLGYGEVTMPAYTETETGLMRLGYIHPANISAVDVSPDNSRLFTTVHEKRVGMDDVSWQTIGGEVDYEALLNGDKFCWYWPHQRFIVGRGRPILEPAFYWIRKVEGFLADRTMLNKFALAFTWLVTITGASPAAVKQRASQIATEGVSSGGVKVTNENESWQALTPNLNSGGAVDDLLSMLRYIAHTCSFPEHWVGASSDVNRSTAGSASEPTIKVLEVLQKQFVGLVLEPLLKTQAELFIAAGRLPSGTDLTLSVDPPDLTVSDNLAVADATQKMISAAAQAVSEKLMDVGTARTAIFNALGMDVPEDIEKLIRDDIQADEIGVYKAAASPPVPGQLPGQELTNGQTDTGVLAIGGRNRPGGFANQKRNPNPGGNQQKP